MQWLGDYKEDDTVYFLWSTNDADGASVTRATDGTVQVYKDNGTTQSTAGITDTEDFDGLTGIHACTIDLSADAFYATGADYAVVLSGATIDGQTVNAVLAHFSIENRYKGVADALATYDPPTKAEMDTAIGLVTTNTDDLADGERLDLLIDAIKAVTDNLPDSGALNDLADILADTGTDGVVLADSAITSAKFAAGAIDSAAIAANAIDAAAIAADAIGASEIADGAIDAGAIAANAITSAKIATDAIDADALKADAVTEIADGLLKRDWASVSGEAARSALSALRFLRNKVAISGSTLTVYKEDDSTPAWTGTVTTDAAADPVTAVDPA